MEGRVGYLVVVAWVAAAALGEAAEDPEASVRASLERLRDRYVGVRAAEVVLEREEEVERAIPAGATGPVRGGMPFDRMRVAVGADGRFAYEAWRAGPEGKPSPERRYYVFYDGVKLICAYGEGKRFTETLADPTRGRAVVPQHQLAPWPMVGVFASRLLNGSGTGWSEHDGVFRAEGVDEGGRRYALSWSEADGLRGVWWRAGSVGTEVEFAGFAGEVADRRPTRVIVRDEGVTPEGRCWRRRRAGAWLDGRSSRTSGSPGRRVRSCSTRWR